MELGSEVVVGMIGIVGALIGAQVFVMKWVLRRSDKYLERLIEGFTAAVEEFKSFRTEEEKVHAAITDQGMSHLSVLHEIQREITTCARHQSNILSLLTELQKKVNFLHQNAANGPGK